MSHADLARKLIDVFEGLPPKHRAAARWIVDNRDDVALLSMREQARRAGVPAATMTRLAQRLGFSGYDELRAVCALSLRERTGGFSVRTEELLERSRLDGDEALTSDLLAGLSGHLQTLSRPDAVAAISQAAGLLADRRRIFCIGARSSFAAVHLGAYLLSLIGEDAALVDGSGATGLDRLRDIGPDDALLAVSISPYTRVTVEAVRCACDRGATVVAVTDSLASPLARRAAVSVIVPTSTPSFLQTAAPGLIAVECIAALVAARRGRDAVAAMRRSEAHLARFEAYVEQEEGNGT